MQILKPNWITDIASMKQTTPVIFIPRSKKPLNIFARVKHEGFRRIARSSTFSMLQDYIKRGNNGVRNTGRTWRELNKRHVPFYPESIHPSSSKHICFLAGITRRPFGESSWMMQSFVCAITWKFTRNTERIVRCTCKVSRLSTYASTVRTVFVDEVSVEWCFKLHTHIHTHV